MPLKRARNCEGPAPYSGVHASVGTGGLVSLLTGEARNEDHTGGHLGCTPWAVMTCLSA